MCMEQYWNLCGVSNFEEKYVSVNFMKYVTFKFGSTFYEKFVYEILMNSFCEQKRNFIKSIMVLKFCEFFV